MARHSACMASTRFDCLVSDGTASTRAGIAKMSTRSVSRLMNSFAITMPGEADLPEVWPDPLPVVIEVLRIHTSATALWDALPDLPLWATAAVSANVRP